MQGIGLEFPAPDCVGTPALVGHTIYEAPASDTVMSASPRIKAHWSLLHIQQWQCPTLLRRRRKLKE